MENKLPKDIKNKILKKATSPKNAKQLIALCEQIYKRSINVGYEQLIRSILVLSDFKIKKFYQITIDFYGDPRDVILQANAKDKTLNYGLNDFM
ncbi:MAG TPA: hypothetical protein EYG89_05765 [Bacteroidia bacterium]|nr:hypothetical protein [Bacteroidia bacterium]